MVLLFGTLYFTTKLHYTKAESGFIMSFYGVGSIFGSYIGGWLADKFNHKKTMLFSLVMSGLILLTINYATNKYLLILIVFLYALTADIFRPVSFVSVTNSSNTENRTRSISLIRLAVNLGFSIGPAIGGIIAFHFGFNLLFILDAITSFIAALFLFIYLPNKNIENEIAEELSNKTKSLSAYKDSHFLKFCFLVVLYGLCFFQLFASVPTFFKEILFYNEDKIGYLLALNGFLVVLIEMPLIKYLEKFKKTKLYIVIGSLQLIIAFCFLELQQTALFVTLCYTFFITLSEILAMPFMMNYTLSRAPKGREGQYSALYSIAYGISIVLAPLIGLYIAEKFGFQIMFLIFIIISLIISLCFYKLLRDKK